MSFVGNLRLDQSLNPLFSFLKPLLLENSCYVELKNLAPSELLFHKSKGKRSTSTPSSTINTGRFDLTVVWELTHQSSEPLLKVDCRDGERG